MLATGTNPARLAIGLAWISLNNRWRSVPTIVPSVSPLNRAKLYWTSVGQLRCLDRVDESSHPQKARAFYY
jgi:hypothetical protein